MEWKKNEYLNTWKTFNYLCHQSKRSKILLTSGIKNLLYQSIVLEKLSAISTKEIKVESRKKTIRNIMGFRSIFGKMEF